MHRVAMISIGLVVLLAVGPQSVQGRAATSGNYACEIRDSDNELLSCTGSGTRLFLPRNAISSIQAGAFDGVSALTRLYLYSNAISSIQAGAFDGLSALAGLFLYENAISSIQAGAFDGLSALTEL